MFRGLPTHIILLALLIGTIVACNDHSPKLIKSPHPVDYIPPTENNLKIQHAIYNHNWITTEVIDSLTVDYPSCETSTKYFVEMVTWKQDTFSIYDGCHQEVWRETFTWDWLEDSTMLLINLGGSPATKLVFSGALSGGTEIRKIQVDLYSTNSQDWVLSKILER